MSEQEHKDCKEIAEEDLDFDPYAFQASNKEGKMRRKVG